MILRYINLQSLSQEQDAGRLLGWVIAANDLAMTFYLQDHFHKLMNDSELRDFVIGGRLYLDRLMCAQTISAISMAPVCRNSLLFRQCLSVHSDAEEAFERILKMNENPVQDEYKNITHLLSRVRNKGMFHYYDSRDRHVANWLQAALEKRVESGKTTGSAFFSSAAFSTRFLYADEVFGEVFFHKILEADTSNEITLKQEIARLSRLLTDAASDVRVVGDTVGKILIDRFPA